MSQTLQRSNILRAAEPLRIAIVLALLAGLAAATAAQPPAQGGGLLLSGPGGDDNKRPSIVKVAKVGGDFTSISAALDSIVDAGQLDADGNRKLYLISVAPGTYAERVVMKPFVDLAGSGQMTSKIIFPGGPGLDTATLVAADNSEVRSFTIESTSGSSHAVAVYSSGAAPRLTDLRLLSSGANENFGLVNIGGSAPQLYDVAIGVTGQGIGVGGSFGVYNVDSSPVLRNVAIHVSSAAGDEDVNYGIWNVASSPLVRESEIVVVGAEEDNHALHNEAGSTTLVFNSMLTGETAAVYGEDSTAHIAHSRMEGGMDGGGMTCIGAFDEFLRPLDEACHLFY